MMKRIFTTLLLLLTVFSYGQDDPNIVLQPNINHKARHLKQSLNKRGDSLILESSDNLINDVAIFNEDFLEEIDFQSKKAKVDLNMLPAGNFVVKAKVGRKRIIMYLQKRESPIIAYSAREHLDESISSSNVDDPASAGEIKEKKEKNITYYWAVQNINSTFGSSKTMRLIYKDEVEHMVRKNKLEIKSDIGKDNTLVIYAIYNKNKFMKKQYRNPKYYKSVKKSKHFNVVPFYSSNNEVEDVNNS